MPPFLLLPVVMVMVIVVGNNRESVVVVVDVVLDPHPSVTPSLPPYPSTPPPPPIDVSEGDPNMEIRVRAFVGGKAERAVVIVNPTRSATEDNGADAADDDKRNNNGGDSGTPMQAPPPLPDISSAPTPTANQPSLEPPGPYRGSRVGTGTTAGLV